MSAEDWKRRSPVPEGQRRTSDYNNHPLHALFHSRGFTSDQGMDWLQEHHHISDLCVIPEDVAEVDARRVLSAAGWTQERIDASFQNLLPRKRLVPAWPEKAPYLTEPFQDSRTYK